MAYYNESPWKLTITRKYGKKFEQTFFQRDHRYKSYVRWEHKLTDSSSIEHLKVERTNPFDSKPNDSFMVVLKIQGVQEKSMGVIDSLTPTINYNPKQWLSSITRSSIYVRIYLYERASGASASRAYQLAGDNYNIFMSELREIWRKEMVDILIKEEIIKKKKLNQYQTLDMNSFYNIIKNLHKRCKSKQVWSDFEQAFNRSFGPIDSINKNNNNRNNNNNNNNPFNFNQYSFGGNSNNTNTNNTMTMTMGRRTSSFQPQQSPKSHYNLRNR